MKTTIFDTHKFEKDILISENNERHELRFLDVRLTAQTAALAAGSQAVVIFVHDHADAEVLTSLAAVGVKFIALRCAGYNNVDVAAAKKLGLRTARVPEYSPHAVAEHALTLMLALNRKIYRAYNRVRELNFSLDGLVGFDLHGKTAGVIGTGRIGSCVAKILNAFGCHVLAHDPVVNADLCQQQNVRYVTLAKLYAESDIITLHMPLTASTRYLIDTAAINQMKKGVMLINTSRGALLKTSDVISALKSGQIGYLGLDVYEEEDALFFEDHSADILQDDCIARLITFPNVLITSHQGFLTSQALQNIAATTFYNLDCFAKNQPTKNEL